MGKTLDSIKNVGKVVAVLGALELPYLAMSNFDEQISAIREGHREYVECAALRTLNARKEPSPLAQSSSTVPQH